MMIGYILEFIEENRRWIIIGLALSSFLISFFSIKIRNNFKKFIKDRRLMGSALFSLMIITVFHFGTKIFGKIWEGNALALDDISLAVVTLALIVTLMHFLNKE